MKKIGWIGTGVMGNHMCGHILDGGYPVRVYNRTPEKAQALVERGAVWCDSPAAVAARSDIVFAIVGFPQDVRAVFLGPDGVVAYAPDGALVVDMTTSEPALAVEIAKAAEQQGLFALDAPVSGGDVGAREAKLAIMVGGSYSVYEEVRPLFERMGQNIAFMGGPGAGQHTKMSNQILIASTMIGVVESLLYATRAGLDLDAVIDIIGQGAASSWSINNLGRRIVQGDFKPGFFIKHFIKDMGIALAEAERLRLSLPGLSLVRQFYISASALGYDADGTQGLYKVLQRLNAM